MYETIRMFVHTRMHHWALLPLSLLLSINVQSPFGAVLADRGYYRNTEAGSSVHSLLDSSHYQNSHPVPWELEKWPTILETIWVLSNNSLCEFCQQVNLFLKRPVALSCLSYEGRTSARKCDVENSSGRRGQVQNLSSSDTSWLWLTYEELNYDDQIHKITFAWSTHNSFVFLADRG